MACKAEPGDLPSRTGAISQRGVARATLIPISNPTFGSNSLILDTSTGLEWLNLRFSLNLTAPEVISEFGPGQQFAGFRYATLDEYTSLFSEVFNTCLLCDLDLATTENFANLFGPTSFSTILGQSLPELDGLFGAVIGPPGPSSVYNATYSYDLVAPDTLVGMQDYEFLGITYDCSIVGCGSFLVRTAPTPTIPEPASLSLFGLGLIGLAIVMWRRAKPGPSRL